MLNATDASPGDFHTERRNKMEQPSRSICEKRTYTVEEVAMLLGISRTSAYEFVKKGEVKFVKIGASIRISDAAKLSLISSLNPVMRLTLTPCSGISS